MLKRTITVSLIAFSLLLGVAERGSIAIADGFDWSTVTLDVLVDNTTPEAKSSGIESSQKKHGNGIVRALGAPFRALGRLFGGGKKNEQQARRTTDKDAAKFESANVIRVKDSTVTVPANSAAPVTTEFDLHLQKGRDFITAGDSSAAIAELTIATSLDPKSGEANKLLGVAYESKGMRERALKAFEAALDADGSNSEHLNNLGYLYYKNGEYERATKYLKRAAKISPDDSRIWNNLAFAFCQREKFDDAYQSFVHAVGEFGAHVSIAAQLQARGYGKDAIKHLEQAKAINPNSQDVLAKLVNLYEATGRHSDAQSARNSLAALKTFAEANR